MHEQVSSYLAMPSGREVWLSPYPVYERKIISECGTAAMCEQCSTEVPLTAEGCPTCKRMFRGGQTTTHDKETT